MTRIVKQPDFSQALKEYAARPPWPQDYYLGLLQHVPDPANGEALHIMDIGTGPTATITIGLSKALPHSRFSQTQVCIHAIDRDKKILDRASDYMDEQKVPTYFEHIDIDFLEIADQHCARALRGKVNPSLICFGDSLQWLDRRGLYDDIYANAKPETIVAACTHKPTPLVPNNPAIRAALRYIRNKLHHLELEESQRYVTGGYRNLDFPFDRISHRPPSYSS